MNLPHQKQFDLVMLDVEHRRRSALIELCKELRALAPRSGILLVITPNNQCDIVHALQAGADDYISKRCRATDLIARCQVKMERIRPALLVDEGIMAAGDLELDLNCRQVRKAGKDVTSPFTFGKLTSVQNAENAGNRTGQVSLRVEF